MNNMPIPNPLPPEAYVVYGPALAPPPPRNLMTLIIDHNPFYLLSILCMLFGCYLFNNSLGIHPGNFSKLLFLLGTLNIYEFLLIGLALVLLRRMDVPRDGRTLTIMETLFLADVTFLNAETVMTDRAWGALINGVLLVLVLVKIFLLLRALRVRMAAARFAYLAVQFALLFAMPLAFTRPNMESDVPELRVYAVWWIVGLLPVIFDVLCRWQPGAMGLTGSAQRVDQTISRLYLLVPFISLVAHLRFNHWVWQVPVHWADYSPVILGLAVILGRARPTKLAPRREIQFYRVVLPAVALLFSLDGSALSFHLAGTASTLDPLKLSVAASYLAYAYCFFLPYMHYLLVGGAAMALAGLFGPSLQSMADLASLCWTRVLNLFERLVPATARAWGLLSMAASFVFLALGAAVSLRKRKMTLPPEG